MSEVVRSSNQCSECSQLLELLRAIKGVFAGEAAPNWVNRYETSMLRGHYLDRIDWALNRAGNKATADETSGLQQIQEIARREAMERWGPPSKASGCPTHGMEHFFEGMCIKCGVVPAQGKGAAPHD